MRKTGCVVGAMAVLGSGRSRGAPSALDAAARCASGMFGHGRRCGMAVFSTAGLVNQGRRTAAISSRRIRRSYLKSSAPAFLGGAVPVVDIGGNVQVSSASPRLAHVRLDTCVGASNAAAAGLLHRGDWRVPAPLMDATVTRGRWPGTRGRWPGTRTAAPAPWTARVATSRVAVDGVGNRRPQPGQAGRCRRSTSGRRRGEGPQVAFEISGAVAAVTVAERMRWAEVACSGRPRPLAMAVGVRDGHVIASPGRSGCRAVPRGVPTRPGSWRRRRSGWRGAPVRRDHRWIARGRRSRTRR